MIKNLIAEKLPEIIDIRHQLHQIPELKYAEFKTADLIGDTLQSYGYEVQSGIGKTGLVALLDTNKPGKTIALRADMDALPILEVNDLLYKSQHPGVMHACGHDGHSATLLLVAWVLQQIKDQLRGKIKLIFQPAEEGGKGSLAMINDGVLESPKVDAIFGYHNWPGLPANTLCIRDGAILAGNGRLEITIHGKIAHTAMPQNAINPVTIGALLITQLEELRKKYDPRTTILNITRFEGGLPTGAMSDEAKIIGIYYIETNEILNQLMKDVASVSKNNEAETGAKIAINFVDWHQPTINTKVETQLIASAAKKILSNEKIIYANSCMMAAEDFSEYLLRVPGCFFLLGAGESAAPVHTDKFDFADEIMGTAAGILVQLVRDIS